MYYNNQLTSSVVEELQMKLKLIQYCITRKEKIHNDSWVLQNQIKHNKGQLLQHKSMIKNNSISYLARFRYRIGGIFRGVKISQISQK